MLVFFLNQWKLHHNKGNHKTKHRKEKSKTAFKYLCHGESVSMVADSWGKWRFHRWPDKDSDSSIKLQQEDLPAQLQQAADRLQVIKTVILTGSSQERQILQVEITFHQRATQTSAEDESLSAQRKSSQFDRTRQGVLLCNLTGQRHLEVLDTLSVHKLGKATHESICVY